MTYRIDVLRNAGGITLSFQGRLNGLALNDLRTHSSSNLQTGGKVEILIRTGSEIDPAIVDDLAAIEGVNVRAESPYLIRWLGEKRKTVLDRARGPIGRSHEDS